MDERAYDRKTYDCKRRDASLRKRSQPSRRSKKLRTGFLSAVRHFLHHDTSSASSISDDRSGGHQEEPDSIHESDDLRFVRMTGHGSAMGTKREIAQCVQVQQEFANAARRGSQELERDLEVCEAKSGIIVLSRSPGYIDANLRPFVFNRLPGELRMLIWKYYCVGQVVYIVPAKETKRYNTQGVRLHLLDTSDKLMTIDNVKVQPKTGTRPGTGASVDFCDKSSKGKRCRLSAISMQSDALKMLQICRWIRAEAGHILTRHVPFFFRNIMSFELFMELAQQPGCSFHKVARDLEAIELLTDFGNKRCEISEGVTSLLSKCSKLQKAGISFFERAPAQYCLLRLDLLRPSREPNTFEAKSAAWNTMAVEQVEEKSLKETKTMRRRLLEELKITCWVRQSKFEPSWTKRIEEPSESRCTLAYLSTIGGQGSRDGICATIAGLQHLLPAQAEDIMDVATGEQTNRFNDDLNSGTEPLSQS